MDSNLHPGGAFFMTPPMCWKPTRPFSVIRDIKS
nr:MAG TPA: hypothetical protein [Caudoviricetes sp.]